MRYGVAICAVLFMFASGLALAGDDKFTMRQCDEIMSGLQRLDGYEDVVKDGQTEKVAQKRYNLDVGLRVQIGQSEAALRRVLEPFQDTRRQLFVKYAKDGKIPPERQAEFADEDAKAQAQPCGVTVPHIKIDELKLKENPIPPSVLGLLDPILD